MADIRTLVSGNPRTEYAVSLRVPGVGVRTRRFMDGMVVEDVVVNMCKAYLYSLTLRKLYDRGETPRRVRLELTRSWIVP
jgi:hypothetical protein